MKVQENFIEDNNRRKFLKKIPQIFLGSIGTLFLISSCENYLIKENFNNIEVIVELDKESDEIKKDLNRIGWGVLKYFEGINYGIPVIIVRISNTEFACFSAMCTHDHCLITKRITELPAGNYPGYKFIRCSCHGSQFDPYENGKVVQGPAEKPLKKFRTEYDSENNLLKIYF